MDIDLKEVRKSYIPNYKIRHICPPTMGSKTDENCIIVELNMKNHRYPDIMYIMKIGEDKWMVSIAILTVAQSYGAYLSLAPMGVTTKELCNFFNEFDDNEENVALVAYLRGIIEGMNMR